MVDLGLAFADAFDQACGVRGITLISLIHGAASFGQRAQKAIESYGHATEMFPLTKSGVRYSTKVELKGNGNLYLSLRSDDGSREQTVSLLTLDPTDMRRVLTPAIGRAQATKAIPHICSLADLVAEVTRYGVLKVPFPQRMTVPSTSLADEWVGLVNAYGLACASRLSELVSDFEAVDAELNDHVFEFNAKRQPVRYRSIICRSDVRGTDRLGPTLPQFRVVTHISRSSGRRNSKPIQEYKASLIQRELKGALAKTLGREPTADEIESALAGRRQRSCSPWITKELISHCYLGKHTKAILYQQKQIAGAMERWAGLRSLFQRLLD